MKLAKVKVEYPCGTTILERVTINAATGEVVLPKRLLDVMKAMESVDRACAFTLQLNGHILTVAAGSDGTYKVSIPSVPTPVFGRMFHSFIFPTKDQQQQNGRFLHTLAAASIVGAVGFVHASPDWNVQTVVGTAILAVLGVVLWGMGLYCLKGD